MERSSYVEDQQGLQAKMIVLGNPGTGKSCLIRSLDLWGGGGGGGKRQQHSSSSANAAALEATEAADGSMFSIVEFPAQELDSTASNVLLKLWEFTHDLSREEEELVFRGALFCIITLDLRSPESANAAFNRWLTLKETQLGESFLFVVGTFLDQSISRRVEIAELCKACAQRDAIYIEVSNLDGSNVSLLRRLIAQRINYMLRVREMVARQALPDLSSQNLLDDSALDDDDDDPEDKATAAATGESKSPRASRPLHGDGGFRRESSALKTAFLEQEIVCDSVGSILASCLGTEFWPGFEQEEENLKHIGEQINDFVHRLAVDPASAPSTPLEHVLHSTAPQLLSGPAAGAVGQAPEPDIDELRSVFEIMGFQLPGSLLTTATSAGPKRAVATAMRSTKLRVKLPTGDTADMILYPGYHVGQQVDAFLVQHDMQDDDEAKLKLIEAAQSIVAAAAREHDQHEDEDEEHRLQHQQQHQAMATSPQRLASGTASFHSGSTSITATAAAAAAASAASRPKAGRKCRVRIALPNSSGGAGPGQTIETVMNEHEDLVALSKRIAAQHGLTPQYQERVLTQLRAALK